MLHSILELNIPSVIIWALDNGIVYSLIGTSSLADR
jgi:hypothetical protein